MVSESYFEDMKNDVYNYLILNNDGTISLSNKMPRFLYDGYNLKYLEKHFEYLNEKVRRGE